MGGLYRSQAKELILYKDSNGMYCTDESGMRKLMTVYKTCEETCQK